MKIDKYKLKCNKCGHVWIKKSDKLPLKCPNIKCQSPYWNINKNNGTNRKNTSK